MRHGVHFLIVAAAAPTLGGCAAKTALDVVTAPVRVVSKGVDLATTSQSEADEKRGRDLRRREERLGQLERERSRAAERCNDGDEKACARAELLAEEIAVVQPTAPVMPR